MNRPGYFTGRIIRTIRSPAFIWGYCIELQRGYSAEENPGLDMAGCINLARRPGDAYPIQGLAFIFKCLLVQLVGLSYFLPIPFKSTGMIPVALKTNYRVYVWFIFHPFNKFFV